MQGINYRGGWALIKGTWLSWMQHRSFFYLVALSWMMPSLIYLFVWSAALGDQAAGQLGRDELVVYYLALILVHQLTFCSNNWIVGDAIREGRMNFLLLRPMSPVFDALASEVAVKAVFMTFVAPLVLLLALILRPEVDFSLHNVLVFIPALVLAWALRFLWGYWLALLSFWATRADGLLALQESLVFLIGGQVAPIALLPDLMHKVATVLPFRYMVGFPVEVLTGQLTGSELWTGFAFQTGWLLVALALFVGLWRRGVKHYSAVGG